MNTSLSSLPKVATEENGEEVSQTVPTGSKFGITVDQYAILVDEAGKWRTTPQTIQISSAEAAYRSVRTTEVETGYGCR